MLLFESAKRLIIGLNETKLQLILDGTTSAMQSDLHTLEVVSILEEVIEIEGEVCNLFDADV